MSVKTPVRDSENRQWYDASTDDGGDTIMPTEQTAILNAVNRLKTLSEPCLPENSAEQLHRAADDVIATIVVSEVYHQRRLP
jgi:hypothetical protein